MPLTADGAAISSGRQSADLLADYVAKAELGDWDGLHDLIERNMRNPDAHPGHVILCAVVFLKLQKDATGKSTIPLIKRLPDVLDDNGRLRSGPAALDKLWLPGRN